MYLLLLEYVLFSVLSLITPLPILFLHLPPCHLGGAKRRSPNFQALQLGLGAVYPTTQSPLGLLYCVGYMLLSYT